MLRKQRLLRGTGMDRRDFLRTTGAAAVAAGTTVTPAHAIGDAPAAPAVRSGSGCSRWARSGRSSPGSGPGAAGASHRDGHRRPLSHRGRDGNAEADLTYGGAGRHASLHPAFAFFAGLPFGQGLDAAAQHAWLAVGGGEMLWDELAAELGFKPLLAGHTGPSAGVWAGARLETTGRPRR